MNNLKMCKFKLNNVFKCCELFSEENKVLNCFGKIVGNWVNSSIYIPFYIISNFCLILTNSVQKWCSNKVNSNFIMV